MKTPFRSVVVVLLLSGLCTGLSAQMRSGKLGIGLAGSMYSYSGEYTTTASKMGAGLSVTYSPWSVIGFRSLVGVGQFGYTVTAGTNGTYTGLATTTFASANFSLAANFMPNSKFNPYVTAGVGYIYFDPRMNTGQALTGAGVARTDFTGLFGGGVDIFFSEFFSASLGAEYCLSNSPRFDGYRKPVGAKNDSYIRAGIELRYYFFDQAFLTRMLDALKSRYEK